MPETSPISVWHRSMRRSTNTLLAVVLLTQPGCMCGCSSPHRTACRVLGCENGGSACAEVAVPETETLATERAVENIVSTQGVPTG